MLTFHEEGGVFFARDAEGVTVATGDEARLMHKGQLLFEQQLANAKPGGSILTRKIKNNLLTKRIKPWR